MSRAKRKIAVVTGTRAEYGLLRSTIEAVADHPRLSLSIVATGMHLLRKFGSTVREIERDGWPIAARVPMQRGHDSTLDQAEGLGRGIAGIARFLEADRSDIIVVLGDRIEAMAGALAAVTTGRFVAHIHGGDLAPGDIDNCLRDSVTKLAHIHLAATRDAAERIIGMGESPQNVHVVGAPGLDDLMRIKNEAKHPKTGQSRKAIVIQHPVGRSPAVEERAMNNILRAVRAHGLDADVVYPNSDRGHSGVCRAIDRHMSPPDGGHTIRAVRSLDREQFLDALLVADVVVGNSSCGIIEAPAAGAPSINVGDRQSGRLRGGPTVIDSGETFAEVSRAIEAALNRQRPNKLRSPYGSGGAGERIAETLGRIQLNDALRQKC